MAIACDSTSLAAAAKCFECLTPKELEAVNTYLLSSISAALAGTSTDPGTLLKAAACFQCFTTKQARDVQLYLLCQIQAAG